MSVDQLQKQESISDVQPKDETKEYYQDKYHLQMQSTDANMFMYGYIKALECGSAFEFGCNAGRHLFQLKKHGLAVAGIDINSRAIEAAKLIHGLNSVSVGDENSLKSISNNSFDVCITVSVLSHIEKIDAIVTNLKRIARKHVIICETNSKHEPTWYRHNYKDYGFKTVYAYHAGKVNAVYIMYRYDV